MRWLAAIVLAGTLWQPASADTRNLPVPAVTLYPGDAIDPQALTTKPFTGNAAIWQNYAADRDQLLGMHAKHTLIAGAPIALSAIKPADLVRRGVDAQATFSSGVLEIVSAVTPLESGAAGDVIQVRNPDSGLTLRATVMPDGTLRVGMP